MESLYQKHEARLRAAIEANRTRTYWSPFQESPSRALHRDGAHAAGKAAFQSLLNEPFPLGQHNDGMVIPPEASPFTRAALGIAYEQVSPDACIGAARGSIRAWRDAGPRTRTAVCMEMLDRLSQQTFLNAYATMHTTGQAFMMAFAGSGANALDRGLEALAMAAWAMEQVPGAAVFTRRFGRADTILDKRYHIVGRGPAVVFSCATYPAWNAYPALFANLATGNPVIIKPHPACVLPMAIAVRTCRDVLLDLGLPADLVQLAVDPPDALIGLALVDHPGSAIVDFTGGQAFGQVLEARGPHIYTETAGTNAIVLESSDDLDATLRAIAHSLCIFSSQMCTAAQNIFVPADGVRTPEGVVGFDEVARRLVSAIDQWVADPAHASALCGAIQAETTVSALDALHASVPASAVLRPHDAYAHPDFPEARTRTPLLLQLDADRDALHRREHFGPVGFLLKTSDRNTALRHAANDAQTCGAIASYAYTTDDAFAAEVEDAFVDAGASVGINLHRQLPINYAAAYSDFHVTGLNPAGTASLTDLAFVADRFRIVQAKRERT